MIRKVPFLLLLVSALPGWAKPVVVVDGGRVQLQGELINGACAVAPDSQQMTVEMGQYRSNHFTGAGSYATVTVPFSIALVDCSPDVSGQVGVMFQGSTPSEDPQVFIVSRHATGKSGVGLALFDSEQQLIIPNAPPARFTPIQTDALVLHFSARYRAVTDRIIPGALRSDVWFTLVYP